MDKGELRTRLQGQRRELRANLSQRQWQQRARRIAELVLEIPQVSAACEQRTTVASYASYGGEPSTEVLNAALAQAGARVVLPVIEHERLGRGELGWADLTSGLAPGARRIPTPTGPLLGHGSPGLINLGCTVIIIPALAVGRDRSRLGQGGGFYDRLLATLPADGPFRLALVGPEEVLKSVPHEPHDQRVDCYVSA